MGERDVIAAYLALGKETEGAASAGAAAETGADGATDGAGSAGKLDWSCMARWAQSPVESAVRTSSIIFFASAGWPASRAWSAR